MPLVKENGVTAVRRNPLCFKLPETGLEPALPVKATRPSTWRVCQFRHSGSASHLNLRLGCRVWQGRFFIVAFRSAKERPFAERKATMPTANHSLISTLTLPFSLISTRLFTLSRYCSGTFSIDSYLLVAVPSWTWISVVFALPSSIL